MVVVTPIERSEWTIDFLRNAKEAAIRAVVALLEEKIKPANGKPKGVLRAQNSKEKARKLSPNRTCSPYHPHERTEHRRYRISPPLIAVSTSQSSIPDQQIAVQYLNHHLPSIISQSQAHHHPRPYPTR
jgi:hypothetical protein